MYYYVGAIISTDITHLMVMNSNLQVFTWTAVGSDVESCFFEHLN